jgi:hypothetical protein
MILLAEYKQPTAISNIGTKERSVAEKLKVGSEKRKV